jgi:hypothetical protein
MPSTKRSSASPVWQRSACMLLLVSTSAAGCGASEPEPPPTPVTLTVAYQYEPVDGSCLTQVDWQLEPRALVGPEGGIDDPVKETSDVATTPLDGTCRAIWGKQELRPGVWELATAMGTCTVLLVPPLAAVQLNEGLPDCEQQQ